MRTREEQIADIAGKINNKSVWIPDVKAFAEHHIIEAERRTEQRVRAEIARDSERLDWLVGALQEVSRVSNRPTRWILEFRMRLDSLDRDTLRQAIDAAREVG